MKKRTKNNNMKKNIAPAADMPEGWFYMSDKDLTAAVVRDALSDTEYCVEYWQEAQVLEIALGERSSMDVEVMDPRLGEEEVDAFLDSHQVRFLCYVTFQPEDYGRVRAVMEHICGRIGGFFCGDTEDFTPVVGAPV